MAEAEGTGRFEARFDVGTGEWEIRGPDGSAGWGTFPEEPKAAWLVRVLRRAYALGRLVGQAEQRAVEAVTRDERGEYGGRGGKDEEHRERLAPTVAAWATECVENADDEAVVTMAEAVTSLKNWAVMAGVPEDWQGSASQRLLREVVGEQLIAVATTYDKTTKRYRGVRLR